MYLCLLGLCSVSALCLGLLFLCVCVLCCVYWVCVLCLFYCVSVCCPFLSMCSLYVCLICVSYMCGVYLLLVCVSVFSVVSIVSVFPCMCIACVLRVCVPVSVSYVYVSVVSLCVPCMCLLFLCMYVVYVSTVFYVYCICYVYVCFSVVCLYCWLPCWCGVYHGGVMGACFLGLVVLVFWGVWRVWNFFIFYSRFGVGGRLLLGFCYRTFFCGFPWGLCHARNFFKDITHSYCGYVAPVMSLCMCLLAYLYRTPRYCADIAPVYTCAPCLPLLVFVSACVYVTPVFHSVLPRYCAYSTPCLASACACSMSCVTFRIGCRYLVLGGCAVWGMLLVVVCFTCWFYTPFFSYACLFFWKDCDC